MEMKTVADAIIYLILFHFVQILILRNNGETCLLDVDSVTMVETRVLIALQLLNLCQVESIFVRKQSSTYFNFIMI